MTLLAYVVWLAPLGRSRALRVAVVGLKHRQSGRAPDPRYDRGVCASDTEQLMLALSARRRTGGGAFSAHGGECRFVAPSECYLKQAHYKLIAIAVRLAGPSGRVHVEMPFKKITIEDIMRMSKLQQQRPSSRRW